MGEECDNATNCNWRVLNSPQKIRTGTRVLVNKRMSGVHANYSIDEIGPNTEKNPEDLKKVVVIKLQWKTLVNAGVKNSQMSKIKKTIRVKQQHK